jgi:hypothetical protein
MPAANHDDNLVVLRQDRHLITPVIRVHETAMEQDHGLALTEHSVPDFDSVYRCEANPIGVGQHWRRRQGQPLRLRINSGRQVKHCEDKKEKSEAVPDHTFAPDAGEATISVERRAVGRLDQT